MGPQQPRARPFELPFPRGRGNLAGASACSSQGVSWEGCLQASPWTQIQREKGVLVMCRGQEVQGGSFPQLRALYPGLHSCFSPFCHFPALLLEALETLLPGLPDRGNNRGLSPTPSPALLSWNQPRFSSQSFALLVVCGFPHSNLWFGVAAAENGFDLFSLTIPPPPGVGSFTEFNFVSQAGDDGVSAVGGSH